MGLSAFCCFVFFYWYENSAFDVNNNMFFADSVTPFSCLFAHKLDYNTQLILYHTDKIAFQLSLLLFTKTLSMLVKIILTCDSFFWKISILFEALLCLSILFR